MTVVEIEEGMPYDQAGPRDRPFLVPRRLDLPS
jgi:hypothetical protein